MLMAAPPRTVLTQQCHDNNIYNKFAVPHSPREFTRSCLSSGFSWRGQVARPHKKSTTSAQHTFDAQVGMSSSKVLRYLQDSLA